MAELTRQLTVVSEEGVNHPAEIVKIVSKLKQVEFEWAPLTGRDRHEVV